MLEYHITATRVDAHHGLARCKHAEITLDTDLAGNPNAFNPAELLLAAVAACMLKGVERVMPILHFSLRGIELHVEGLRQDNPPKMASIRYEIIVDTDETDRRLELLHENVKKFGTIYQTVAAGTELVGTLSRKLPTTVQSR
jgi:uncharacterized OsmC-like protein